MWFTDSEVFFKKPVLKHFAILASVFNNFSGLQAGSFFKKRLQHRCFPANIAKFLTTTFLNNIWERLKSEYIKKWNQGKQVFCKKGVLEYLLKITGKHLYRSLFFNEVTGYRSATLLKSDMFTISILLKPNAYGLSEHLTYGNKCLAAVNT